jgi:integrase
MPVPPSRKPPKRSPKGGRTVKHVLKDGTVKTYRYAAHKAKAPLSGETVLDLIRAYERSPEWARLAASTKENYTIYLRPFMKIKGLSVREIDRRGILELRDAVATHRGPGAATGFVRAASALFGWAVDHDWLQHSPCHRVKGLATGHLPAWTEAQLAAAIACLPEHLRRAVVLAVHTGQRRGDLIALRWSDISGGTIRLRQQKTGAELALPIHPALAAELAVWRAQATALHVLTDVRGKPWTPLHLSGQLPYALARIGLPRLGIHGLRKLAAARLADAGCTTHEIAAITGHRTLSMLALYTRTADQERLASVAVSKLTNSDKRQTSTAKRLK